MAEQPDIQTQLYFQPWSVPQQENVKTIIIQQPAETHMNLDASTDKTAIGSFAIAMIIAVVLGGLATWYAYWCAKRSFELTRQSFDSLILQIQSSEQITLATNQQLIKSQELQKEIEINFEKKMRKTERLLDKGGELLVEQDKLIIGVYKVLFLDNIDFEEQILKFNQINQNILSIYTVFMLLMEKNSVSHQRFKFIGHLFLQIAWELTIKVSESSKFYNLKLGEDFFEEHVINSELLNNLSLFKYDEVELIKKAIHDKNIYEALLSISSICQHEIHDYILAIEAA